MEYKLTCDVIAMPSKTNPKESVGLVFVNEQRVYSIMTNLDDIIKSNSYFGAKPYYLYFISQKIIRDKKELNTNDFYYIKNHYNEWYIGKFNGESFDFINNRGNFDTTLFAAKKIIATNDESLNKSIEIKGRKVKDAFNSLLPKIPKSFILDFVEKQGDIKEVELEHECACIALGYSDRLTGEKWSHPKYDFKVKTNLNDEVIVVSNDVKIYSYNEVVTFLAEARMADIKAGSGFSLEKWIKENLTK